MTELLTRLTNQLRSRHVKNAKSVAAALLTKRGHMKGQKLTAEGERRERLGNAGRAKDRAAKALGGRPEDYKYNPKTNKAKKNGKST